MTVYESRIYDASAVDAVSVTASSADQQKSRGVWIGVTQSLDFCFDGTTWLTFKGCTAGTLLPLQVVGARKTAAGAAPTSADVILLY